ncbi:MAG: DUF4956 domain-containing protein [Proteobacteria bacterium]|nr:DUF4956 domain-containing protein [Pseudomonadota bacterium]
MIDLLALQTVSLNSTLIQIIYTVFMAFLLSVLIGFTYTKTFKGLSYSNTYVQALILSPIVSATIMQAIGDSLGRGLGMIGALSIIRFRTNFKDAKDILFIFASLAAGIGCGVGAYTVSVVRTLAFVGTAYLLYFSSLGQVSFFDGMLRFNIENSDLNKNELENILKTYCQTFALITLRDMNQGKRLDYAYHVKLKKNKKNTDMINCLPEKIPSIKDVTLMLQETTVEL